MADCPPVLAPAARAPGHCRHARPPLPPRNPPPNSARPHHAGWRRCPPGHGDIYPSLLGSSFLDSLLKEGIKYLFVSNSDNLGATLDLDLLAYFAGQRQVLPHGGMRR